MTHPFKDYLVCRNNYLEDPDKIALLAKGLDYSRSIYFPGLRTDNLFISKNLEIKKFANQFADRLSVDVFPGISRFQIFLCFHINEENSDKNLNQGWIHNDTGNLAGLIYLTKDESNFETGTSVFNGYGDEAPADAEARRKFHIDKEITPEYIDGIERNRNFFTETIRIGNQYNRLLAYDAKMFHRPNSFSTAVNKPRLSLLFFITEFFYQ